MNNDTSRIHQIDDSEIIPPRNSSPAPPLPKDMIKRSEKSIKTLPVQKSNFSQEGEETNQGKSGGRKGGYRFTDVPMHIVLGNNYNKIETMIGEHFVPLVKIIYYANDIILAYKI